MGRLDRWLSPGVRYDGDPSARDCARCGYPFAGGAFGAPAPCTECGAPLDPALLGSLRPRGVHRLAVKALHAPGTPLCTLATLACLTVAIGNCVPEGFSRLLIGGIMATAALAFTWLLRVTVAATVALRARLLGATFRQRGWWAMPLLMVGLMGFALSGLPMVAMFRLQRPNLAAAAAGRHDAPLVLLPGTAVYTPGAVMRLGQVEDVMEPGWVAGGSAFAIPGTGFVFEQGVYFHLPNMPPERCPWFLRPLGGGWYAGRHED